MLDLITLLLTFTNFQDIFICNRVNRLNDMAYLNSLYFLKCKANSQSGSPSLQQSMTKELNDYVLPDYVLPEYVLPALYEGPMPPPSYPVPPEDVSLWKVEDSKIYETWKKWVSKDTKKTKKKFRKFLSQVNTEHQEVFDLIADGLWGLRRLLAFMQKFPGYNLEQDLECYNNEENLAVIKIVDIGLEVVADEQKRCGLEVVCEKLPTLQPPGSDPQQLLQQPAKDCPSDPDGYSCIAAGEVDVAADQAGKLELKVENKTEITNNKTPFERKDNEKKTSTRYY